MKKYVLLISIISIFAFILLIYVDNNDKLVLKNDSNKQIVNSNAITMMYETDVGSGEYQVSSDNAWPQNGYVFNETLLGCENGSKLMWDEESKRVNMQTNTSDSVYFDKKNTLIIETLEIGLETQLNNENVGDGVLAYEIGDVLKFISRNSYTAGSMVYIYGDDDTLIKSINMNICYYEEEYLLTGLERKIVIDVGGSMEFCPPTGPGVVGSDSSVEI